MRLAEGNGLPRRQAEVGAVGAKLLYGDGRIQHAGVVLGVGQHAAGPGVAGHFGHYAAPGDPGYLGQFVLTRELSAVTGACLAFRREVFEAVGGLNETALPIAFNDVDFCLRIRAQGFRIIWSPLANSIIWNPLPADWRKRRNRYRMPHGKRITCATAGVPF